MQITVKAARINAGKTQEEIANTLQLSLTGYQRKENRKSKFYVDEMVVLSQLLKIPIENFSESQCRKKTQNTG